MKIWNLSFTKLTFHPAVYLTAKDAEINRPKAGDKTQKAQSLQTTPNYCPETTNCFHLPLPARHPP